MNILKKEEIFSNLNVLILKSNKEQYKENTKIQLTLIKKFDEGSYGIVFIIENNHVLKLFKNSTLENTISEECTDLIPVKYENRELMFYLKYINNENKCKNIINIYAIGITKNRIEDKTLIMHKNTYFIILPYCTPFYKTINTYNLPLIDNINGIKLSINIMKKLLDISFFLEEKYNLINLDFKISNIMFNEKNLVVLDFSIIKANNNKKYNFTKFSRYFIWPFENNILLDKIPSYSICINGLEILFGYDNIRREKLTIDRLNYYLNIIKKKNNELYNIFLNGLILKITTSNFIKLIKNFSLMEK